MNNKINNNKDEGMGCGCVGFLILITGLFIWVGGFQFIKDMISDPESTLATYSSGYRFENGIAEFGLIMIGMWLVIISLLFGWLATKSAGKMSRSRHPAANMAVTIVLSVISILLSATMFLLLVRYVDIIGETIMPANNNLVWKGSGERVTMAEQRGWGRRLLFGGVLLAIAIFSAWPATHTLKQLGKNRKR